ncbi:putative iron-regulated membrane protein [Aquimarina sp. MAR_2010_214]|uniref:PepSY-associated TM helix domain-containing protein n=1 Tax=Aquimarina sp. MAR_2010_214 TaxID=1250026 RepID=UPI000C705FA0|nr:PepSY-associated TM helix domain-containing protein [Aquimarina sp. MAR_2010_214]PKV49241.1 putative iron-regulated membrane protein [Aquimarina sp. MAR_2010_214]
MSKRSYNVFFNTHTVSGIVISVALYVIFFAGAFALFKEEIAIWEEGELIGHTERDDIDYDKIFETLDDRYELTGRDLQLNFGEKSDHIFVFMGASKDSLASEKGKKANYFSVDINSVETKTYSERYSLGEFLYRLHFFAQLPVIGMYLAGFISFFFLFAIVTGVIVHWKKIIPNFYSFNPKIALKKVWTDAHTVLGVIGLPFQFIFAVTGTYFCLSVLVLIPANALYNNDQVKLMEDLRPERKTYEWIGKAKKSPPSFNDFSQKMTNDLLDFHITNGFIKNYGGSNMKYVLIGEYKDNKRFIGTGRRVLDAFSGKIEEQKNPDKLVYTEDVQRLVGRLHYGDFGGIPMKIIYFSLALITCFVIITGVLIWIEARNKKSMTISQRLYTAKVGHIYLAICLSMLPITALAFLFVKFSNGYFEDKQTAIYYFYFITWLIVILFFRFKRDNYIINKYSLLFGAIFGFLVPVTNGIMSGNWLWSSFSQHQYEILLIDIMWIIIASISLIFYLRIRPKVKNQSIFDKNPIDYKNISALKAEETKKMTHNNYMETNTIATTAKNDNYMSVRTKIIILWMFIILGFIFHHIYGLASIFFNESVLIEGATGETPFWAHQWRILMEGLAFFFAVLTVQLSKSWFRWASFVWAIIVALFNVYHVAEAIMHEASNYSEILILLLMAVASIFLVINLNTWRKIKAF